jgi:hypothetical protein
MQDWMRRVATGLALPLAVGAPVLLVAAPAHADAPTHVTLTSPSNPSKYGEEVRVTAHVWGSEEADPVSAGAVQFEVDAVEIGDPVPVDSNGNATSAPIFDEGGVLEVTMGSDFYLVTAEFIPTNPMEYAASNDSLQQRVDQSGSTMAILPTASTIVVDLSGLLPGGVQAGSARPSGSVDVVAGGQNFNDVPVDPNTGTATLNHTLPPGQAQSVSATYAGDSRYTGSSASRTRHDPVLEARVLSIFPRSKSGWYRSAVDIWFRCHPMGAELVGDCPDDVTLKKSGKNQSVTRTIVAVDGGSATVTVGDIDIDRKKPVITITGRTCDATDQLSGLKGSCRMKIGPDGHFTAVARDKAGNRAVKRGVLD